MEKQSNVERLAGYIILIGFTAAIGFTCWYFRSVLIYVILAFVVSLISLPLTRLMRKVKIKGKSMPDWLLAMLSILIVIGGALLIVTQVIPVVISIIREAALFSNMSFPPQGGIVDSLNNKVEDLFPAVGKDFDLISLILNHLKSTTADISITGILGSVASAVADVGIGLFAVIFISFFLVKDEKLFSRIVGTLVPDRFEASVTDAIGDIEHLLSRYFIGLVIEMLVVAILNFLGLWAIARIGFTYALGIGFIAGILNIIPYVGPLIGEILGVVLCTVLKYGTGVGLDVNIVVFAAIVLAIMLSVQLIDNFVLQPIIYSSSIQATPLEIFIVMLMAGHMGGMIGMLAAIPTYTVIRVMAGRFFYKQKIVRRLMPDMVKEVES